MEDKFVVIIDECDNSNKRNLFSNMISKMNPNWNEETPLPMAFNNAVKLAEKALDLRAKLIAKGETDIELTKPISDYENRIFTKRKEMFKKAMEDVPEMIEKVTEKASIITFGGKEYRMINLDTSSIPYPVVQSAVEGTNIIAYTFPMRGNITLSPLEQDGWKIPIPERWQGADEDYLKTEAKGLEFCHAQGICLAFNTVENCEAGIIQMLEEAYPELANNEQITEEQNSENNTYNHDNNDEMCM